MKNGIKYTVILIAMLLSTLAILFYFSSVTVFASNNLEDKQQEESFEDFLAFESDVMSFNDDTKVEQISVKEILGHSYSEVLMEKVDEKILDNYCEQNEAYYIETEQGFEVYSDYALKKIIITA